MFSTDTLMDIRSGQFYPVKTQTKYNSKKSDNSPYVVPLVSTV